VLADEGSRRAYEARTESVSWREATRPCTERQVLAADARSSIRIEHGKFHMSPMRVAPSACPSHSRARTPRIYRSALIVDHACTRSFASFICLNGPWSGDN